MKCIIQCPHLKPPMKNSYVMCFSSCKHKPFDRSYSSYLRILKDIKKENIAVVKKGDILYEIITELYQKDYIDLKYNSTGGVKIDWEAFHQSYGSQFTKVRLTLNGHMALNELDKNSSKGRIIDRVITILITLFSVIVGALLTQISN